METPHSSDRESGFPRLGRSDRQLFLAWTEAGATSRLRFQAWPLSAVPAATELPEEPAPPAALPLAVGAVMPAYSARSLEGKVVDVASLRGHPVLINADGTIAWSQTGAIVPDDPALAAALERALQ